MKKEISYKDLVLNTMLDAIRRQGRYTIDNIDIMNYEGVIKEIIKYNELDTKIDSMAGGNKFIDEIKEYTYLSQLDGRQVYTLLPWISKEELEETVENTIFSPQDMSRITEVTKEYLRFSRDYLDLYEMNRIERKIENDSINSIETNIKSLECSLGKEKRKLHTIKSRIKLGE